MHDPDEPHEPSDEDMAELLGVHPVEGLKLPSGHERLPLEDSLHEKAAITGQGEGQEENAGQGEQSGVIAGTSGSQVSGVDECAGEDEAESLESAVHRLPMAWMRAYVLALYTLGDPVVARKAMKPKFGTILPGTVNKGKRECPAFAALLEDHLKAQHEAVDSAIYRGATEGDNTPFNTKEGVEWYKRRSDKAGETWYKRHGLMAADQVQHTHSGRVEMVDDSALKGVLSNVAARLFGSQPKAITGKVVSEPDKNEG